MKTTSDFDDEFYEFLLRSIPAPVVEMLHQHFLEQTTGLMSFDRWLANLPNNPEMMQLLLDLYNYDQMGKQEKTAYRVKLTVFKIVKHQSLKKEVLDKFSDLIASGGLDKLIKN